MGLYRLSTMDSSLAPAAKAGIFAAVTAVQLAVVVSVGLVRPSVPEVKGGAPVINLTLSPSVRFDGENGAQESDGQVAANGAAMTARSVSPVVPRKTNLSLMPTETVVPPQRDPSVTVQPIALVPVEKAEAAANGRQLDGAAETGDQTAQSGVTAGGGARSLGGRAASLDDDYAVRVLAWVERHKGRPGGRLSGAATLRFVLDRHGRIRDAGLLVGSGDRRLDATALDALRAAEPFPRPPPNTTWRTREFRVRLDYRPREGGRSAR